MSDDKEVFKVEEWHGISNNELKGYTPEQAFVIGAEFGMFVKAVERGENLASYYLHAWSLDRAADVLDKHNYKYSFTNNNKGWIIVEGFMKKA